LLYRGGPLHKNKKSVSMVDTVGGAFCLFLPSPLNLHLPCPARYGNAKCALLAGSESRRTYQNSSSRLWQSECLDTYLLSEREPGAGWPREVHSEPLTKWSAEERKRRQVADDLLTY